MPVTVFQDTQAPGLEGVTLVGEEASGEVAADGGGAIFTPRCQRILILMPHNKIHGRSGIS